MCGICGFSEPKAPVDTQLFEAMVDMVDYRGPDGRGSFYENQLALGHRRLAIVDLSEQAAQPFTYMDRYVAVYNGEIFNYREVRVQLAEQGYSFATASDTEVLLAAYDFWGEACVEQFNGMWGFCIYDRQTQSLFCSRDRFGVKPFYYIHQAGRFGFASEIKQLLPFLPGGPQANEEMLLSFLALGEMDHTRETLFKEIYQLLPGHNLVFNLATRKLAVRRWYTLQKSEGPAPSYEAACEEYRRRFFDAVSLRLRADVPVGSCLSGGVDSSAIVGTIHALFEAQGQPGGQHTVSSCYEDPSCDERAYVDAVLQKTNASGHKIFPHIPDEMGWLDTIIWHMDEPTGSSSAYSQWSVFEEARRLGLPVMLDGQGADEQLGGYTQFVTVYLTELLKKRQFRLYRRELRAYRQKRAAYVPVSTLLVTIFCLSAAFLPGKLLRGMNRVYLRLFRPKLFSTPAFREKLLGAGAYNAPSTDRYIRDSIDGGLRVLLHSEDRNSMAHSVESRVPFMDPNLVEYSYGLPFAYKIRDGVSKAVLRDAMRDVLPEEVYARYGKMGFPAPEERLIAQNAAWFRGQLAQACTRFPALLPAKTVLAGFERYLRRPQQGEYVWWRIMSVNRWAEIFKLQPGRN